MDANTLHEHELSALARELSGRRDVFAVLADARRERESASLARTRGETARAVQRMRLSGTRLYSGRAL